MSLKRRGVGVLFIYNELIFFFLSLSLSYCCVCAHCEN